MRAIAAVVTVGAMALSCILWLAAAMPTAVSLDEALTRARTSVAVSSGFAAVAEKRALNDRISPLADGLQIAVQPGWRFLPSSERQAQMGLAVTQPFRLGSYSQHRRDEAMHSAAALAAAAELEAFSRETAAMVAWFALWEARTRLAEAGRERALAARTVELVGRSAQLQVLTAADASEAQSYLSEAELQRLNAEGELWDRSADLARAMGERMTDVLVTTDDLPAASEVPRERLDRVGSTIGCHPRVRQEAALARASRSREREEATFRAGRFDVGLAAYYDNPRGFVTFLNLGVDLGLFDRGERDRGSALAAARQAEGRAEDAAANARTTLTLLVHERAHREEVRVELSERLVPALERLAEQNEKRLSAGDIAVFELLQTRRRLLSARARLHGADAQLSLAQQAIARFAALFDQCDGGAP